MPRTSENPRYNVISLRVTDEEREQIEAIMVRERHQNVSDLLCGVITYWLEVAR